MNLDVNTRNTLIGVGLVLGLIAAIAVAIVFKNKQAAGGLGASAS
jgi:hypothetical protein